VLNVANVPEKIGGLRSVFSDQIDRDREPCWRQEFENIGGLREDGERGSIDR
jgi:hypothetical protein